MLCSKGFSKTGLPETQTKNIQAFWDSTANWFLLPQPLEIFSAI
jgi:RNAse (barnase) inhibitor barstar